MFKRRNGYEEGSASRTPAYRETDVPPRIFEAQDTARPAAPYRTPTQAYPHHREEAQDALNQEVSEEESWKPTSNYEKLDLEEPETTIGQGVHIKGELTFQRFLRIDGEFEGELISDGKIIVGPTGVVRSNLELKEAIIEGRVEGNISVQGRLELRGNAEVHGDIQARLLAIDEGVTLVGNLTVRPATADATA